MKTKHSLPKKQNHLAFLKSSGKAILFITLLFLGSTLFGFLNANTLSPIIAPILKGLIEKTSGLSGLSLIIYIFINNALASFIGLVLGIFLGIFPLITTITNGVILGFVLERTVQSVSILQLWRLFPHGIFELPAVFISLGLGINLSLTMLKNYLVKNKNNKAKQIAGILSLLLSLVSIFVLNLSTSMPNYAITLALFIIGLLYLAPFIFLFFIADKKTRKFNIKIISNALKVFFLIVIPLLVIAAIIEGLLITFLP